MGFPRKPGKDLDILRSAYPSAGIAVLILPQKSVSVIGAWISIEGELDIPDPRLRLQRECVDGAVDPAASCRRHQLSFHPCSANCSDRLTGQLKESWRGSLDVCQKTGVSDRASGHGGAARDW